MKFISKHFDNHFHEGFKIIEQGKWLSNEQLNYFRKRIRSLIPKTPYGAFTTLTLEKDCNFYCVKLEVIGLGSEFTSELRALNLQDAFNTVEKDVHKQLISWKKDRFLEKLREDSSCIQEEVTV